MSNLKISQLTPAGSALSSDVIPIERSGANFSVTVAQIGSGGGVSFATPGQGFFWSNGQTNIPFIGLGGTNTPLVHVANQVIVWQFTLLASYTISKVGFNNPNGVVGAHVSFGIYNAAGTTLLLNSGVIPSGDIGAFGSYAYSISPSVTLSPGTYWFAQTADTTSASFMGVVYQTGDTLGCFTPAWASTVGGNTSWPLYGGLAANASSAGVLPATLGTIGNQPVSSPFPSLGFILFIV